MNAGSGRDGKVQVSSNAFGELQGTFQSTQRLYACARQAGTTSSLYVLYFVYIWVGTLSVIFVI